MNTLLLLCVGLVALAVVSGIDNGCKNVTGLINCVHCSTPDRCDDHKCLCGYYRSSSGNCEECPDTCRGRICRDNDAKCCWIELDLGGQQTCVHDEIRK